MKDQLAQYVNLLFAGATGCEDIKQEILQNTLDRYDDLIDEGKTPEAAYRLAIIGIGDINEILNASSGTQAPVSPAVLETRKKALDTPTRKLLRAIGVALYILCPTPVLVLGSMGMGVTGVCGLLAMVAVATVLVILGSSGGRGQEDNSYNQNPKSPLERSINSLVWAIGLALYFILSFLAGAWHITWVIFPLTAAVKGLIIAIMDLKEDKEL